MPTISVIVYVLVYFGILFDCLQDLALKCTSIFDLNFIVDMCACDIHFVHVDFLVDMHQCM